MIKDEDDHNHPDQLYRKVRDQPKKFQDNPPRSHFNYSYRFPLYLNLGYIGIKDRRIMSGNKCIVFKRK